MTRTPWLAALLAALALCLAAWGTDRSPTSGAGWDASPTATADATTAAASCDKGSLQLYKDGRLTVGTDKPAFPPYFEDDDPTNGKGFESAVAYAVAEQLGFTTDEVDWTVVPFHSSYAPGQKKFAFDITRIPITPKRAERVNFSEPYFTAPQAVIALKSSDA